MRFDGKMVKKPWGMEYCAFDDGNVAVWYLHIRAGQRTSQHLHEKKSTSLNILSGDAAITKTRTGNFSPDDAPNYIPRGTPHSTLAVTDAWVMEIETPSDKTDLVRLGDDYGRKGKPYENGESVIDFDPRYAYPSAEFPA